MSRDPNIVLQDSLDAVDRFRTRLAAGVVVLFVTIVFALGWLMATGAARTSGNASQVKILFLSVTAQMVFVALCTVVIAFQISRMTKAILRAVELSSQDRKES
jgi:ammonia channel protein AmtB